MPPRRIIAPLLALAVLAPIWLRAPVPSPDDAQAIAFAPVSLPPAQARRVSLGAFRLEGIWVITSRNSWFGGYSGLVALGNGQLLAISDQGRWLRFAPPGAPPSPTRIAWTRGGRKPFKGDYDAEAVTRDPATGRLWLAWETTNAITRHAPDMTLEREARPAAMQGWGINAGPEAMVRLRDGRFIVLREGFTQWHDSHRHRALVYSGDPLKPARVSEVRFAGPARFSPTDMAQLPDGRVLVLMRRLVWPLPYRFAGLIALADPQAIRGHADWPAHAVARLSSNLPVDNFEGLAIEPRSDGRVTVWLISDDNNAVSQRTLLWKLSVDPRNL